jgi:trimeric autotransporter adhesin
VLHGATGNDSPGSISLGRTGSEPGYPSAYWYYDNIIVDYLTAKFPIVPGTGTPKNLVSIAVTPTNPSIPKGAAQQFTATGTYSDGSTQNLTNTAAWSSSNASVATINSTGLATGVGNGNSTIQAASGSVTGSTTLTVTAAVLSSIAVTPANPSIRKGMTQHFRAAGSYSDGSTQNLTRSVVWSSSNTSVATISNTGLASGVGPGSSTIQAVSGSVAGSTTLTVRPRRLAATSLKRE